MRKQIREVQPAHKSDRITVAQAVRAFRQVRGGAPKVEFEDDVDTAPARRGVSSKRLIVPDTSPSIAAEKASSGEKIPAPARRR